MSTGYQTVAKNIIKSSIQSAIFIDDNLAIPFKAQGKPTDIKISRELYNSFAKHNVSIDFYRYSSRKNWQESSKFLFKGRDLVVLDWQLDNNDIEENTLKLLHTAVNTPSLHFVCIYTSKNPSEFADIAYSIKAFFSSYNDETIKVPTDSVKNFLDEELGGISKPLETKLKTVLKEYSLHNTLDKSIKLQQLDNDINSILGFELAAKFKTEVGKCFKKRTELAFEAFGYGLSNEFLSEANNGQINFFLDAGFLTIENTIILITNKSNPRPSSLYAFFTEAVLKSTGNFLSLLSLDLKSILRDSSGFISKEMDLIDETAFFYHKDSIHPKEAFFEFLLDLWKSNLTSLLYSQSELIQLFDETKFGAYRKAKKIDSKIAKFKKRGNVKIDLNLAKLNYYYNILENRNLSDFLRFGDIFNILDNGQKATNEFLMCITAHCDCLHVDNIKSQFFFVKGKSIDNTEGLKEGDTGNNSFIKKENDIVCIKWSQKPFTVYLANNKVLTGVHEFPIAGSSRRVKYSATIKENYTQRIANHAFSHPMRVGIFFAKKF